MAFGYWLLASGSLIMKEGFILLELLATISQLQLQKKH